MPDNAALISLAKLVESGTIQNVTIHAVPANDDQHRSAISVNIQMRGDDLPGGGGDGYSLDSAVGAALRQMRQHATMDIKDLQSKHDQMVQFSQTLTAAGIELSDDEPPF